MQYIRSNNSDFILVYTNIAISVYFIHKTSFIAISTSTYLHTDYILQYYHTNLYILLFIHYPSYWYIYLYLLYIYSYTFMYTATHMPTIHKFTHKVTTARSRRGGGQQSSAAPASSSDQFSSVSRRFVVRHRTQVYVPSYYFIHIYIRTLLRARARARHQQYNQTI